MITRKYLEFPKSKTIIENYKEYLKNSDIILLRYNESDYINLKALVNKNHNSS